jgi:hypothetical protein
MFIWKNKCPKIAKEFMRRKKIVAQRESRSANTSVT